MHFNIYIDDQTGKELTKIAKRNGKKRNALIRETLEKLVAHQQKAEWPSIILNFQGIKDYPPFESHRKKLKAPKEDPFA